MQAVRACARGDTTYDAMKALRLLTVRDPAPAAPSSRRGRAFPAPLAGRVAHSKAERGKPPSPPQAASKPDADWAEAFEAAVKAAAAAPTDRAVREAQELKQRMAEAGVPRTAALYARLIEAVRLPHWRVTAADGALPLPLSAGLSLPTGARAESDFARASAASAHRRGTPLGRSPTRPSAAGPRP